MLYVHAGDGTAVMSGKIEFLGAVAVCAFICLIVTVGIPEAVPGVSHPAAIVKHGNGLHKLVEG